MKKIYVASIASIALFILNGCSGGGDEASSPGPTTNSLLSIAVTPAGATIAIGSTQQYAANGTYADGTKSVITTGVTWSADGSAASIVAASGLATGKELGVATVTATVGTVSGNTTLAVQGPYIKVSAGGSHTVALKADGSLVAWGGNRSGQLGDGTANDRIVPTPVGTAVGWSSVSTGKFHTAAIRTDGSLWTWGFNQNGQLGDGTYVDRLVPTQIGTEKTWTAVSVGEAHTVALKKDGTVWAWGRNFNGQLGDQSYVDRTVPTKVYEPPLATGATMVAWTAVSAGAAHTVGRRADGTIWSWGNNDKGQLGQYPTTSTSTTTAQPKPPVLPGSTTTFDSATKIKTITTITTTATNYTTTTTSTNFGLTPPATLNVPTKITSDQAWVSGPDETWVAVSAGGAHTLAIRADGAMFAWGANDAGQLGIGSKIASYSAMQVGTDSNWAMVSAGGSHSVAVKSAGTLWAWGLNSDGQLGVGDDTVIDMSSPEQIGAISNWTAISAGLFHTFAIKSDNTLWGWGRNKEGQQGNGTLLNAILPANLP